MTTFSMTIGGSTVPSAETFDVRNPASNEVFAAAPECTPAQLDEAMETAAKAYRDWRIDDDARRACLRAAAAALSAAADELAPVLTAEQGKPLGEAVLEIHGAAWWFTYYADLDIAPIVIQDNEAARVEVARRPLGVVAGITPWNFPVVMASWKIAPALRAGNTMVLKPSPYTPLTTLKVGEVLAPVLPPGVLNVITGGDSLGARMTMHAVPRKVSFTGSVATGKRVAAAAADDLKRVTLELGGNDPAIVLDDADTTVVADKIFSAAFANNGQVCSAIKRVYVHDSMYDEMVEALAARARETRVGDGTDPETQLGPINNRPQFDRVSALVADALSAGAVAAAGGKPKEGPGNFFEPTIVAGITDGTRLVDEEQFGPALPVIAYRDVDDVVERANATHFGLCGSVWTADADRGEAVAERLECGTAWINTHMALAPDQPFGGMKWSGIGRENGVWGHDAYTELQVVHRAK